MLHTAAWTDVDGAEADPQGAAAVNVAGTAHAAALRVPLVTFSTDYVFDGRKRTPYVESDGPNPMSAYGRTKLHGEAASGTNAWILRTSWLFGATGHNFLLTMLRLGVEHDEVTVVDDQRGSPTYVGHLAGTVRRLVDDDLPKGLWHVAADRRLHLGGLRRGDLRGGGPRLHGSAYHDGGARSPRTEARVLRASQRALGCPAAPALA